VFLLIAFTRLSTSDFGLIIGSFYGLLAAQSISYLFRSNEPNWSDSTHFKRPGGVVLDSRWMPGSKDPLNDWLAVIPIHQDILDEWFHFHPKYVRYMLHKLAVNHLINQHSEWVILDVEYTAWLHGMKAKKKDMKSMRLCKIDLLGVKREDLNGTSELPVYVMELKKGNGSIQGDSGITSHAEDMEQLICDKVDVKAKKALLESLRLSTSEKQTLGLLPNTSVILTDREIRLRPAFIFESIEDTTALRNQKKKAQKIFSDCQSEILWLEYSEMLA
ncbi:MAG: hypothetical protein HOI47_19790, partial [Candidatus Scalindua sp.]|nr:hypothetical protein [Candidatus Scalindua sp.]